MKRLFSSQQEESCSWHRASSLRHTFDTRKRHPPLWLLKGDNQR
ncbi:hypothetical protein [Candidatus Hepatobacter penaei]|nr:hypothetical protein [Candidatus Hepatobacter penaei]